MSRLKWLVIVLCVSGCSFQPENATKVFTNAQVQYDVKGLKKPDSSKRDKNSKQAMEMPSYFLDLEYEPSRIALNETQIHKIDSMLGKIIYPEDYKLYISFGVGSHENNMETLALVYKRAQTIKAQCSKKIKNIKVAYLKNQRPDSVYLRLLT